MDVTRELGQVEQRRRDFERLTAALQTARARLEAAIVHAAEAGATQREVAAHAGYSQPYISQVVAQHKGRFVPTTELGFRLAAKRHELLETAREHGLRDLRVFGSVARGDDDADSDIDLMAELPDGMGLIALGEAEQALSTVLGVRVDLVPARSLKPRVRTRALADAAVL